MPPPIRSVTETGSTLNLPLNEEYVVVEEQPRGRLGLREVGTAPDDEEWWCLEDKIGCDTVKCFCFKWSFSIKWICCDNQAEIDKVNEIADARAAAIVAANTRRIERKNERAERAAALGLIDPPEVHQANLMKQCGLNVPEQIHEQIEESCSPPQVVNNTTINVLFLDVSNSLS